jgi:GT2 family glycosyltransferase
MYQFYTYIDDFDLSSTELKSWVLNLPNTFFLIHPDIDLPNFKNAGPTQLIGVDDKDTRTLNIRKGSMLFENYDSIQFQNLFRSNNKFDKQIDHEQSHQNFEVETKFCARNAVALIPMYNQAELVIRCIEGIKGSRKLSEIVVLDDGSKVSEFTKVQDYISSQNLLNLKIKKNKQNLGFTKSVNTFLQNLDDDLCFVINSDTTPSAQTLENLLKIKTKIPKLASLGTLSNEAGPQSVPKALSSNIKFRNDICSFENCDLMEAAVKFKAKNIPEIAVLPIVHGFFYLLDVNIFKEIGGFNEKDFFIYGEENDFNLRVWKSDYISAISLRDYVYHEKGASYETLDYNEPKQRKIANSNLRKVHGKLVTDAGQMLTGNIYLSRVRSMVEKKLKTATE